MKLLSLALKTNLIFNRFSGNVIDRGEYIVVKTDSRPNYFWGNFLIMNHPPESGDLEKWIELFEKEIGPRDERGFIALTWDAINGEQGEIQPFLDFGFSIDKSVILTAESVRRSPKHNPEVVVRPLESDEDWARFIDIHFEPDWQYGDDENQKRFLAGKCEHLRAMVDCGLGVRFGAGLRGKLVGEAGIYWDGQVGRFNDVVTHRDYRRRGVCSTLVYAASKFVFELKAITTLVMEADPDYHAARIYESAGFNPVEKLTSLEWFDRSKFR